MEVGQAGPELGARQEEVPQTALTSLGLELLHDRRSTPRVGPGLGVDLLMEGALYGKDDLVEEALHALAPLFDCWAVSKVHD